MTPTQLGPWILATWIHLAACVGVHPGHPPQVIIGPNEGVSCPALTGKCVDASCQVRYDGECAGLHRGRRIWLGYKSTGALPHELLHDLLRLTSYGTDKRHAAPYWKTCLNERGEPR